tara:strand:- start:766 stop:1107 length:342 start_codon:yes stop_codon:yes gene_type:complete
MSNKSDPAWLKALKKEADDKGLSFNELLVKYMPNLKDKDKKKTTKPKVKAAKGGMMKKKGYAAGGAMKKTSSAQKGLKKLPSSVRNKMGYMAKGGMTKKKKGYAKGGVMKKKK